MEGMATALVRCSDEDPSRATSRAKPCAPQVDAARFVRLCTVFRRVWTRRQRDRAAWAKERAALLTRAASAEAEVQKLKGEVREHARSRFGRRSEQQRSGSTDHPQGQKRGQQPGRPGHGRRSDRYAGLPEVHVTHDVSAEEKFCEHCGRPRVEVAEVVSGELEIRLEVHHVVHHRKVYAATCDCAAKPFVRGAAPLKLIPRASLSVPTIAFAAASRYMWGLPLHRLTTICSQYGADVPDGTLVGVFHAIHQRALLQPIYDAICARNRRSKYLHADETTWRQLWLARGKRGYIWCFVGSDTVVFLFDPGRDHSVVLSYLGLDDTEWGGQVVELICDFMAAYDKAARLANAKERRLELNRCWVHYRRLLVKIGDHYPGERRVQAVIVQWLEMIGDLFRLHHERDLAPDGSQEQWEAQAAFAGCLDEMQEVRAEQLARPQLAPELRHFLEFGQEHWDELTRCAADPHQPIHNNRDEREIRHPGIIRKNAYGSGAEWAAHQTCQFLTIGRTLLRQGQNPLEWNLAYFDACARAGGQVPEDWERFLPWVWQPQPPEDGGPGSRAPVAPALAAHNDVVPPEPERPAGGVSAVAAALEDAFTPEPDAAPRPLPAKECATHRDGAIPDSEAEHTPALLATAQGTPVGEAHAQHGQTDPPASAAVPAGPSPIPPTTAVTAPAPARPTAAEQRPAVRPSTERSPLPASGLSAGLPAGPPLLVRPAAVVGTCAPVATTVDLVSRPAACTTAGCGAQPDDRQAGNGPELPGLEPSAAATALASAARQSPPPASRSGCGRRLARTAVLRPFRTSRASDHVSDQPP